MEFSFNFSESDPISTLSFSSEGNSVENVVKAAGKGAELTVVAPPLPLTAPYPTEYTTFPTANVVLKRAVPRDTSIDGGRDIVPGVYEGGFKCWECSVDLFDYLLATHGASSGLGSLSNTVLELGCGHGFPGVAALKLGAKHVIFSDLNQEVLEQSTWPTLALNCAEQAVAADIVCIAGDFTHLPAWLMGHTTGPKTCDLVLSAETLYTAEVSTTVYRVIERVLSPSGTALLATKRYYFGCGGGAIHFTSLCEQGQALTCETVSSVEDGKSNIRDILLVRRRR